MTNYYFKIIIKL